MLKWNKRDFKCLLSF